MKKILTLMSMIGMLFSFSYSVHAVAIDATSSGNWTGYMSWFDKGPGDSQGAYVSGSDWAPANLRAAHAGGSLTLSPNTNAYADVTDNAGRAYWTNSPDGGATAGSDGNKFMEATYKLEAVGDNTLWNGQTLTFSGNIDALSLDSRYNTVAFIKTLDSTANWATVQNEVFSISSTGSFSLSLDVNAGSQFVAQIGFTTTGVNANPATDWGNVQLSNLIANAVPVPEPSTYALIAGFAAFLFVAIRRRK